MPRIVFASPKNCGVNDKARVVKGTPMIFSQFYSVNLGLILIVFLLDALGQIEIIRVSNANHHAQRLPVM